MPKAILHTGSAFVAAFLTFLGLDTAKAQTASSNTVSADLRYEEVSSTVADWSNFTKQPEPFKTEPKGLSSKVFRANLKFGTPKNGMLMVPLLWDPANGKLYLDANRNGDLTDDPSYSVPTPHSNNYQSFGNVHLAVHDGDELYEQALAILLYNYIGNDMGLTLSSKSCWLGRVSLQGADWQVGLLEESGKFGAVANGHLLLRPWTEHDKPFSVRDDALSCVLISSQNLFLGHQAYHVDSHYVPGVPPKYQIEFTPQEAQLGDLQLSGKYVNRLVLNQNNGGGYCVVLDKPEGKLQVPVGIYQEHRVSLTGNIQAMERAYTPNSISVTATKMATLSAGGPLTNTVSVARRGEALLFSYSVVGANGKNYTSPTMDRSKPPQWVVYRGEKKIASGNFEFG